MIVVGTAISNRATYEEVALPGIQRIAEPDTLVLTREGCDSIQRPYNEMMADAAGNDDLEALVLLHQDLELTDDSLLRRVRPLLRDPGTGLIGALGWRAPHRSSGPVGKGSGSDVPEVSVTPFRGRMADAPENLYGSARGPGAEVHFSIGSHDVEIVDGVLLVIAPWVVRSLSFDERLADDFHGYDIDFSLRVRVAGGRVICNDIPYFHHMWRPWRDFDEYVRARVTMARRWDPELRPPEWSPAFQR